MIVSPAFAGKRYAVLGLARSGLATVDALLASGADVIAWDGDAGRRAALAASAFLEAASPLGGERLMLADPLDLTLTDVEAVVVSPGVPLNRHPIRAHADAAGVPIIGDIELFAQAEAGLPAHRTIGITGTNGKSTTTALIHHMLETAGVPALTGGNIGLPILSREPLPEGGVYVLELSSYQIDITVTLDCDVVVLTNITPDHLDRYDGFRAYADSKCWLFGMQQAEQVAVIAADDDETRRIAETFDAWGVGQRLVTVHGADIADQSRWPALQGPHNAQNAACAIAACEALGLDAAAIARGLETYPGLPHRMERVGEHGGVLFVNDSKATNATATAPALGAYKGIHWILGGVPKTDELDACVPYYGNVAAAYTIGEAGPMFADLLAGHLPVTRSITLAQAVRDAAAAAKPGEVVMLSPACASFDQYRDYEARGDAFRAAVRAL